MVSVEDALVKSLRRRSSTYRTDEASSIMQNLRKCSLEYVSRTCHPYLFHRKEISVTLHEDYSGRSTTCAVRPPWYLVQIEAPS